MSEEKKKQQSIVEKEHGNEAYKKKEFSLAIGHYSKAKELDPTNITFYTNTGAVYFEQAEYDKCIEECQKAIDVGREHRADYKLISKAFSRMGMAYLKKDDLDNTLLYYNKSLSEHRVQDMVFKINDLKKKIEVRNRLAYLNPEMAIEEKVKGNDFFKKGQYPEALKHYNEAVKRNPDEAILYSNRAACYTKLAEFRYALKDCDDCIRLNPTFLKGYLRKGACLLAMKDPSAARQAYEKALDLDSSNEEAQNGYRNSMVSEGDDPEAIKKRAMNDPEIKEILTDPGMQLILQQMQSDPKALQEHLKNPAIATKIGKLLECGIIAIR